MILKNLKVFYIFIINYIFLYLYDFYIFDNSTNLQFWCVEINTLQQNIKLPFHCDEGPYRFASQSIENFLIWQTPIKEDPFCICFIIL